MVEAELSAEEKITLLRLERRKLNALMAEDVNERREGNYNRRDQIDKRIKMLRVKVALAEGEEDA